MAQKRNRATFEADVISPYAVYGTPIPLDPEVRDDGTYVPIWKQEVTDEQGRKRFHGAFTGGYSAGYFNSVGSKEGWTPSTFVSSRTNRAKDQQGHSRQQQRPEDFMDEEDHAEAEAAKTVATRDGFDGIGETADDKIRRNALIDLMRPKGASIGTRLLQKMGWKLGQGIGPKVMRQALLQETGEGQEENRHLFAPSNVAMISLVQKTDSKGLGYTGELPLNGFRKHHEEGRPESDGEDDSSIVARSKSKLEKAVQQKKKVGFGVGVLNDNGSDDDDPYSIGPKIAYKRSIGPLKKPKKPAVSKSSPATANPLLTKPIFRPKRTTKTEVRKCADGRLPLDGFVLAMRSLDLSAVHNHPPLKVPDGWSSSRLPNPTTNASGSWKSTADAAKESRLDPKARSAILGEQALPGKSVFDFITPASRNRLADASGRKDLPQGLSQEAPEGFRLTEEDIQKSLWSSVPDLDKSLAVQALGRSASGWIPYADDEPKRGRYIFFLQLRAGLSSDLPPRPTGMTIDEWRKELGEFVQAAQVFRPVTGLMASRFTSSSSTFEGGNQDDDQLLRKPTQKPEDPAEEAAKMGMFGPLTRTSHGFLPTRLVCKRFGVKPPERVDAGEAQASVSSEVSELVPQSVMDQMRFDSYNSSTFISVDSAATATAATTSDATNMTRSTAAAVIDIESNPALEKERPGDAVFKAVFGSDDEESE
jgi:G patch domain-containing protein 1